ncbi:hypothetical protein M758_7G130700 [Ceratodon purpureus]|nr:hypothetical protein M758_7G130700 [Ceratodon purpureus]
MAAGEGRNMGTKRKASEALPCIVIRQVKAARPIKVAEGKGVVLSKEDQEITERFEENLMELYDPVFSEAYSGGLEQFQHFDVQQKMPLYCEAESLVMCDEYTEDTEDHDEYFDEDSDFDTIINVLREEIPARWRSGEITDEEAFEYYNELATLMSNEDDRESSSFYF